MTRFSQEILLLSPYSRHEHILDEFLSCTVGKLGLPKLAVAVGNFKKSTKLLFGDAQATKRAESDRLSNILAVRLTFRRRPGDTAWTPAQQKIAEFRVMMQRRLAAGIDQSKKHWRWLLEAGIGEELGSGRSAVPTQLSTNDSNTTKMVMLKLTHAELRKAER